MAKDNIEQAIASLKDERDRLDGAIRTLEALRTGGDRDNGATRSKAAAKSAPAKGRGTGRRKKRAPRGLLKKMLHEVLSASKKPLTAAELRNRVMKAGYPSANPQSLYTSVYVSLTSDAKVKKTKAGFALKGRA